MDDDNSRPSAALAPRILDNLIEGCQLISPDYRYLYVNEAATRHGQTARAELLGRAMAEVYPGIDETEMFRTLQRCMQERAPAQMENEFTFPDGSTGWFELRFEPVPDGVAILSADISQRKHAEAALGRTMRALRTLSHCNQIVVRAEDESQLRSQVCESVVKSAGYPMVSIAVTGAEGEALVRPVASAGLDDESRRLAGEAFYECPWWDASFRRACDTGEPQLCEPAATSDDPWTEAARARDISSCIVLPMRRRGECIGALTLFSTESGAFDEQERALLDEVAMDLGYGIETLRARAKQRQTEEQLAAAQRLEAVGRLAGGVAHDFNNLLSVILSYAGFALEQLDDSDPLHGDIAQVHDAGQRAATLTKRLLAFSRRQVLEPQVTSLSDVVHGLESMLRRLLGEDIDIDVRAAPDVGNVMADPAQVEQIVMNLAVNAKDAMPRGGKLTIATDDVEIDEEYVAHHISAEPGPHVRLTVTDTGTGMDAETRERIFEPFYTTKETGKGTGLGLSMVYGTVKQSGGNIWVYSEPGRGTTFKIYLPRVDAEAVERKRPRVVTSATGTETVLVVEDEDTVRRAAERILRRAGYTVMSASSGEEALGVGETHGDRIDLLLTDVVMPEMDGPQLAERLRQDNPILKVLFTSGYTDDAIIHHGVLDVDTRFLSKPFTTSELANKVREVLDEE